MADTKIYQAKGDIISLIPLLCANVPEFGNDAQAAADAALAMLREGSAAFDVAAQALLSAADACGRDGSSTDSSSSSRDSDGITTGVNGGAGGGKSRVWTETNAFIEGCRYYITGNLNWR
jgi:hypothetical protein